MDTLAQLEQILTTKNDGSYLQTVLFLYKRGELDRAAAVCMGENDKITLEEKRLLFVLLPEYRESQERIARLFGF